jgi:putative membrane protein
VVCVARDGSVVGSDSATGGTVDTDGGDTAGDDDTTERGDGSEHDAPVVGREAVRSLVLATGLDDPESSRVNCLLAALRTADDLRSEGERAIVAVVAGGTETVNADRAIARQIEDLVATHRPEAAVVVVDSAEDERLVPVIESRVRVDAVDRVVVRQARDLESTYYQLKQFLADEQLRRAVLVPLGIALLAVPVLLTLTTSPTVVVAVAAAVVGSGVLYKGLGVDDALAGRAGDARGALYSGQVSIVTYVVAAGLALVGIAAGGIGASELVDESPLLAAMAFAFDSVPWLAAAGLAAAAGRLLDEWLRAEPIRSSYLYLPFLLAAVGLVVRGFAAYFLERAGTIEPVTVAPVAFGPVSVRGFAVGSDARLAAFVVAGVLVSLLGVRVAATVGGRNGERDVAR